MPEYLLVHKSFLDGLVSQLKARAETLEKKHEERLDRFEDKGMSVMYDGWTNPAARLADMLGDAETIRLPGIYELVDLESETEVSICAWDEEDACERATEEYQYLDDPDWRCVGQRGVAWPGLHAVRLSLGEPKHEDEEMPF